MHTHTQSLSLTPYSTCACARARASFVVVLGAQVSGDGRVVLEDSSDGSTPVDLPLALVLADMPKKTFKSDTIAPTLAPLELPHDLTLRAALDEVLRKKQEYVERKRIQLTQFLAMGETAVFL